MLLCLREEFPHTLHLVQRGSRTARYFNNLVFFFFPENENLLGGLYFGGTASAFNFKTVRLGSELSKDKLFLGPQKSFESSRHYM